MTKTHFVGRIQALLVLVVIDDLATICPDLFLLVFPSRLSHEALPLAVPTNEQ